MSHLNEMATQMSNREMLIRALCKKLGIQRRDIEVHDRATAIHGYHEEDNFDGHVIVRKGKSGIPSDIGWELKNGTFVAHVDKYDYTRSEWGGMRPKIVLDDDWANGLQDVYNQETLKQGLTDKGVAFKESTSPDGYPVLSYYVEENSHKRGISL
jgi:hypothetical protein